MLWAFKVYVSLCMTMMTLIWDAGEGKLDELFELHLFMLALKVGAILGFCPYLMKEGKVVTHQHS